MKLSSSEKTKHDDQHQPLPITVRPVPESGDKTLSPEKSEAERQSNI